MAYFSDQLFFKTKQGNFYPEISLQQINFPSQKKGIIEIQQILFDVS